MKQISYSLTALLVTGIIWLKVAQSEETKKAGKHVDHSTQELPGKDSAATFVAIPKIEPHSCGNKNCSHNHHQHEAVAKILADRKNETWPIAVIDDLRKKHQLSTEEIRHIRRALNFSTYEQLSEQELTRVAKYTSFIYGDEITELLSLCWAEGTPPAFREAMEGIRTLAIQEEVVEEPMAVFQATDRWLQTATDGAIAQAGTPVTLTWGFIADDTEIGAASGFEAGPSDLIAQLNATYGASPTDGDLTQAPWFEFFETAFNYWAEVTGNTYIYVTEDDGVILNGSTANSSRGALGVRPDVRIGGKMLDGNAGVLAFNYFPDSGDMVIDTADSFNLSNNTTTMTRFRNVIAHEHGHGLGISHVCPINQTKLMEPTASTAFIGVQFDDMITSQALYGDPRERNGSETNNDNTANASDLGTLNAAFQSTQLAISDTGDVDYFKFRLPSSQLLNLRLIPTTQAPYLEGSQLDDGSCEAGVTFDPNTRQKLSVRVLDTNGTTVIAVADAQEIGLEEVISNLTLPQANQDYFIEISGGGENSDVNNNAQVYTLELDFQNAAILAGSDFLITEEACTPANGAADPGEVVTAQITISNASISAINTSEVTLNTSPNLTIIDETTKPISSLAPGESTTVSFQFAISGECGAEETLNFTLTGGTVPTTFSEIINLGALVPVINEGFESSSALPATLTSTSTNTAAAWTVSNASPIDGQNSVFSARARNSTAELTTGDIASGGATSTLSFDHNYIFAPFDGAVLEISIAGGEWQNWLDAGGTFTAGGYTGTNAWLGAANTTTTIANFPPDSTGQNVQIRWRAIYGIRKFGGEGWRIDNIKIDTLQCCETTPPIISIITSDDFAQENDVSDQGEFTVNTSAISATNLNINYTLSGNAAPGSDFVALTGAATIPAGQLTTTIPVTAIRDNLVEGDETVLLTLSSSSDYTLGTSAASLTILDIPFDQWRNTFFGDSILNIGDGEDFDSDGVQNLIEYALGLDPTDGSSQNPLAALQNGGSDLTLSYEEDTTLKDIQYIVEVSPTLGVSPSLWTTQGVTLTFTPQADGKRTVTATTTANIARQFMRLRVVRN